MKKTIYLAIFALLSISSFAQKKTTTSAILSFDATTPLDALPKADNNTVIAALDLVKGTIAFEAMIRNFSFSNPMMQDHFNGERWMNSEKYPTATFKGNIVNLEKIDFTKAGKYTADVEGDLTIHGVTKKVKTTANISVTEKEINTTADFTIKLEDYEINGGAISAGKVAKEPKITVSATF